MLDLIERLEKATGPDRELDAEIAAKLKLCSVANNPWIQKWAGEWKAINGLVHLIGDHGSHGNFRPAAFTSSLDAALTLVPDGLEWQVSTRAPKPHAGRAYIHNNEMQFSGGGMARNPRYLGWEDTAATPILALCLAALCARAASTAESNRDAAPQDTTGIVPNPPSSHAGDRS
jgi:hypothetical protein